MMGLWVYGFLGKFQKNGGIYLMSYKKFTDLDVWKEGRKLRHEIFELAKTLPADEKYKLTDQIIRSSDQ